MGLLVLAISLGLIALVIFSSRKKDTPPDYYALFNMGLVWLLIGIPFTNYGLSAIGIIFMLVGLVNRSAWKKNKQCWANLKKKDKNIRVIIIIILIVLFLITSLFLMLGKGNVL